MTIMVEENRCSSANKQYLPQRMSVDQLRDQLELNELMTGFVIVLSFHHVINILLSTIQTGLGRIDWTFHFVG